MKSSTIAPKTGVGYSAGKNPPKVSTKDVAHPKASDGNKMSTQTNRSGDAKGSAKSGHAMLRRPY